MVKIRNVLMNKVFPKLFDLEEQPKVKILRAQRRSTNPFDSEDIGEYGQEIEVPCLFSEQPEMVTSGNNIVVQHSLYLYIRESDAGQIDLTDRFIFRDRRYRPVEVQYLFGLWRVKVVRG